MYQCLITVLRQFFKSICTTKCSDGEKKAFAVPWLQIITTQWTNICLVNISGMHYFLVVVMLFEFHHMLLLMPKSHRQMNDPSNVRKAARRASCWPQDLTYAQFHRAVWGLKGHLKSISACHPVLLFFPLLSRLSRPPKRNTDLTWTSTRNA